MKNKKLIRITEADLRGIVQEAVKKCLNESKFNDEKYWEWAETKQIPDDTLRIVERVAEHVGISIGEEEAIDIHNRYGETYAFAKGFTFQECTSSMEVGPHGPTSETIKQFCNWLKGLDFVFINSHGNYGNDTEANYHDTYVTHEVIYKPSLVYMEKFTQYTDEDYEERYDEYIDW